MSMTDPVADMLTRIRNAVASKHRRVDMPASKLKIEIARILKESNFIQDFRVLAAQADGTMSDARDGAAESRRVLRVILKYAQGGQPVIRELKRISTPGLRKYVGVSEIPRVRNGLGMAILSTSQGLMSDRQARQSRTGGEVLALIW